MTRIRINFGPDFCGEPPCEICFRNADSQEAKADRELQKELDSYNQYNANWMDNRKRKEVTNKFKVDTTKPITLEQIKCPRCNGPMVVRTNRNTQQKFLGCRLFPDCRGTRELPAGFKEISTQKEMQMPSIAKEGANEGVPGFADRRSAYRNACGLHRPQHPVSVENESTIKGKLPYLQKEAPKSKEPVKEVSFADLLSRPATLSEESAKIEGEIHFLHLEKKEKSENR